MDFKRLTPSYLERTSMTPDAETALKLARELAMSQKGGQVFEKAQSSTTSMLGQMPKRAYYNTIPASAYQVGDLIVFKGARGLVVHPIEAVRDGAVFPKGTFNSRGDGWVPVGNVVGKVDQFFSW